MARKQKRIAEWTMDPDVRLAIDHAHDLVSATPTTPASLRSSPSLALPRAAQGREHVVAGEAATADGGVEPPARQPGTERVGDSVVDRHHAQARVAACAECGLPSACCP